MNQENKKIEEILKEEAEKIIPSQEVFFDTLKKIDLNDVTEKKEDSYLYQTSKNKGRPNNILKIFMKLNRNIVMPVIVIVVIAVILIVGGSDNQINVADNNIYSGDQPEVVLPQAKADVDATVDAIIAMAENEANILLAENTDLDLVDLEIQSLDDFGNAYDIQGI